MEKKNGLFTDSLARKVYVAYPEGRNKAFTLSYDDGWDCDRPLVEMMRSRGVKGTFHLNSGRIPDEPQPYEENPWRRLTWKECLELYGDDMEIAVHGAMHPRWTELSTYDAMLDILDDRRALERATGRIIRGASYPFGKYNDEVVELLRLADIQYCRAVQTTGDLKLKADVDWLRFEGTCRHKDPELMTYAEKFCAAPHNYTLLLFYVWGHSYEFVRHNNLHVMEQLLDKVSGREDVWYATNIEIVEYLKTAGRLVYNMDETIVRNPTDLDVWLRITPGDTLVKVPAATTMALPE